MDNQRRRLVSYNALRGICAIGILLSHMSYLGGATSKFWSDLYFHFFKYGSRCTSFFFIMSGFLVAYTWKDISFNKYIKGKIKHIYPLTILVFFLAVACGCVLNDTVNEGMGVGEPLWILSLILNPLLLKAYVPIEIVFYSFHGPSWYISVLFGFYIIAYFVIKKLNAVEKNKADLILESEIFAIYFLQLMICVIVDVLQLDEMRLYLTYVNPYFRIFGEGMVGVLLCRKMPDIQNAFRTINRSLIEIIAIIVFIADFLINNFIKMSFYSAWIQVIPMSLLLVAFYKDEGSVSECFRKKGWQKIGEISFELYMTHAFVYEGLPIICKVLNKEFGEWIVYHAGIRFLSTLFACIAFAGIVHFLINMRRRKSL